MLILNAVLLSLLAGLATGLGGGAVAVLGRLSMRTYDSLLGFAAGVMICGGSRCIGLSLSSIALLVADAVLGSPLH
jgi:zinc transporter ZupT